MFIYRKYGIFFIFFFLFIFHASNYNKSGLKWRWKNLFPHSFIFVNCFNNEGHEAIGMTAMSGLTGDQLYELKKLLSGNDLVDIGKWGHLVHQKINNAEKIHFHLQDGECSNINFTCKNENGLCLLNSIKYFYYELLKNPTDQEKYDIKFIYPRKIVFTDADRLKYLVSLISDMHQPLRLGFLTDNGGKDIKISYTDANYEQKKSTLFNFLEYEIIDKMVLKYSGSWYGGWTHVNRIYSDHKKDEELFKEMGIDVIDVWAKEIISEFCSEFYLSEYITSLINENGNEFSFITKNELVMPYTIEYQLERLIRNLLLRAGSRISIILKHVFLKKKFAAFRKRSEFDRVSEAAVNPSKFAQIYRDNALFINLSIFFIILIIFFYVNTLLNNSSKGQLPTKAEQELQEKCN